MKGVIRIDNNIFENGWNKNNAYTFGWIMSDGCLLREGRNKTAHAVRICSNDYDIIEWLHTYLCVGNKIYKQRENNYTIKFRNKEAISFMMDNELTERKSLTVKFPNIPDKVLPDFIRGYFDGNGSVVLHKTKYNIYGQISITCGSLNFLESLQNRLRENNIHAHIYRDGRSTNASYYLRVIKRSEIEKMYEYMYSNLNGTVCLRRKYDKYTELIYYKPKYQSHIA